MAPKQIKVGNVIIEIPEVSGGSPLGQSPDATKLVAEMGDEVKPLESLPLIPNPNDFVGSSVFQAHAIGRVGTSDKKWVNTAG
ncbi:MAG: hypothetical protein HYS20_14920, partial [Rhodocyclales bacterium]|nr:hypothetical protein [Rhodocyclales bacterium]